jgi:hypothetical protein
MLALSAEGNKELRQRLDAIISAAPSDPQWEFYASRQPTGSNITLTVDGVRLSSGEWLVEVEECRDSAKLNLLVIDAKLASIDDKTAMNSIFLFLDSAIGEDAVEEWIGVVGIRARPTGLNPVCRATKLPEHLAGFLKTNKLLH